MKFIGDLRRIDHEEYGVMRACKHLRFACRNEEEADRLITEEYGPEVLRRFRAYRPYSSVTRH
jgi:hypothetical protein